MKGKVGSALSLWLCEVEGSPLQRGPTQPTASPVTTGGQGQEKAGGVPTLKEAARSAAVCSNRPLNIPACKFVNVELLPGAENGIRNPYKVPFKITVLLENPSGANALNYHGLVQEVRRAEGAVTVKM